MKSLSVRKKYFSLFNLSQSSSLFFFKLLIMLFLQLFYFYLNGYF